MDPDARTGRVTDVALGRLQTTGFAGTTLEDIARAADLPDADLRACFGDMEGLLRHLVSPLVDPLDRLTASAAAGELRRPAPLREVIEGYFDTLVAHRAVAGLVLADPDAAATEPVRRVRTTVMKLRTQLAGGPDADLDRSIRAAAALAAVESAVLEFVESDQQVVRDVVIGAAMAILLSALGAGTGP